MKFEDFTKCTIEMSKQLLEIRRALNALCIVHIPPAPNQEKGRILVLDDLAGAGISKDAMSLVLLPALFKSMNVDMYAFIAESWCARCPEWANTPEMVRVFRQAMPAAVADWPDSMKWEGVMIFCESKDGEQCDKFYELVRSGSDIDLVDTGNQQVIVNRWAGLLK